MSTDIALFGGNGPAQLPAHLQGQGTGVGTALMAAIGDMRNRISLKGNRFRQVMNGQEIGVWDENYLDVIIVGVVPTVSRLFYKDKFSQTGDNKPPTCYSVDNITPADDVHQKQSDKCATCPQNIKGSRTSEDGFQSRACGFFRRLVIILPGDPTLYYIDVKAMGLFGDSQKERNLYNLNDYAKFLNTNGVDASVLVTRLSFDTDESVPKLFFKPARYVEPDEWEDVKTVTDGGQVTEYLVINMKTVDISAEVSADQAGVDEGVEEYQEQPVVETAPAPAPRQAAPAARPAASPAPRQAAPAQQPAPRQAAPAQRQAAPATAPRQAAPAQRQAAPAQAAPAQRQAAPAQRTTAPAARQAAPAARQAAPATRAPAPTRPAPVQTQIQIDDNVEQVAVEVGSDTEMQDILADLGL